MSKIFNISDAASLGIHSLAIIAKSKKQINANMIAQMTNFSKNHLSKILIYESIEGELQTPKCDIHNGVCLFNNCIFGGMDKKLTIEFREFLKNKTLFDAIK